MVKVSDIVEDLMKRKDKFLTVVYKDLQDRAKIEKAKKRGRQPVIKRKDIKVMLQTEQTTPKLKTGTLLDVLLGGGLEPKSSMLLYGEYGSGKTQTCLTMAATCPNAVIYIDVEHSFKATRILQICDERGIDFDEVYDKIWLYQPANWIEQMWLLNELPSPMDMGKKLDLVILDSLTKAFRGIEFAGRQSLTIKQPMIREYVFQIDDMIRRYDAGFIFTTQIYENPQQTLFSTADSIHKPVGGSSILHQGDSVIFLRRGKGNLRIARLMDSSFQPLRERPFLITAKGIEDLPKKEEDGEEVYTEKAGKIVERGKRYDEKGFPEKEKIKEKIRQELIPVLNRTNEVNESKNIGVKDEK